MNAISPAAGNMSAGSGQPRAERLHLLPLIGSLLLVAGGTLYFWFSSGRHLATDIGVIRRIGARAAALSGLSSRKAEPKTNPVPRSGCAAFASCAGNKKASS